MMIFPDKSTNDKDVIQNHDHIFISSLHLFFAKSISSILNFLTLYSLTPPIQYFNTLVLQHIIMQPLNSLMLQSFQL